MQQPSAVIEKTIKSVLYSSLFTHNPFLCIVKQIRSRRTNPPTGLWMKSADQEDGAADETPLVLRRRAET